MSTLDDHARAYGSASASPDTKMPPEQGPCVLHAWWVPRGLGATRDMCAECARERAAKKDGEQAYVERVTDLAEARTTPSMRIALDRHEAKNPLIAIERERVHAGEELLQRAYEEETFPSTKWKSPGQRFTKRGGYKGRPFNYDGGRA